MLLLLNVKDWACWASRGVVSALRSIAHKLLLLGWLLMVEVKVVKVLYFQAESQ